MGDTDQKVTLLICDDHKILTDALATVVGLDPTLVMVTPPVHDPETAIDVCAEQLPDVVLMDIVFKGGMSGIEATRRIKEVSPSTKVVIMTAHDEDRLLVEAVEAGASGFLGKDEAAEEVLAAAKAAADGEVLIDPATLTRLLAQVAREREEQRDAHGLLDDLTEREREILQLLAEGMRNDDIATQALHQPADRADPRPEHPGQAARPLEARGRRVRRQARRHHGLALPDRPGYPVRGRQDYLSHGMQACIPATPMKWADNAGRHPLGGPPHDEGPESTPPSLGSFLMWGQADGSAERRTFPDAVRGSAGTRISSRGALNGASRSARNIAHLGHVRGVRRSTPGRRTRRPAGPIPDADGRRPPRRDLRMVGQRASTSSGQTVSAPVRIASSSRPCTRSRPSVVDRARDRPCAASPRRRTPRAVAAGSLR